MARSPRTEHTPSSLPPGEEAVSDAGRVEPGLVFAADVGGEALAAAQVGIDPQRMKLTGAAILVSRGMKALQAAPADYPYR